jgi:hypothetical protein
MSLYIENVPLFGNLVLQDHYARRIESKDNSNGLALFGAAIHT